MALADVPPELIARVQRGDKEAFDELFERTRDDVFRWLFSMLRDEDEAEEVLQECYIRVLRHLPRLRDPSKFGSWIGRMIVNLANTHRVRARKQRTEHLEEGWEADEESLPLQGRNNTDPRAAASRREVLRDVNAAIRQLPPKQRTAVMLFDVRDWTIKEIAEELGCSEGAVKYNIFQGRRKLRHLLADYVDEQGNPTYDSAE